MALKLVDPIAGSQMLKQTSANFDLAEFMPVPFIQFGQPGACYWNCDDYVARYGGSVVHGWQAVIYPLVFLELLHHAVVRAPDGNLIDPTPAPYPHNGLCAFSPDDRVIPSRDYPAYVLSLYSGFEGALEEAGMMVAAHENQMLVQREIMALAKEWDSPYVPGKGAVIPIGEDSRLLFERYEASKVEMQTALDRCREAKARIEQQLRQQGD